MDEEQKEIGESSEEHKIMESQEKRREVLNLWEHLITNTK